MSKPTTIIINGHPGTGSTTASNLLAEHFGYEHVYGGQIFRDWAAKEGKSIEEFMSDLADNPQREREIDDALLKRATQGNAIIESRVLAWLVPKDAPYFKVWLTCDFDERVRRIQDRESFSDRAEAAKKITYREGVDAKRYQDLYGISLEDHSVFDLVVDTTSIPVGEVANRVIEKIDSLD